MTYDEEVKRHVHQFALDLGEQLFDFLEIQSLVRDVSSLPRRAIEQRYSSDQGTPLTSVPFEGWRYAA